MTSQSVRGAVVPAIALAPVMTMAESREQPQEKRGRILAAAIRVFARKGYTGSRVSDIAEEANVAYGLVYHYFENKEQILNEIFESNWGVLVQVIRQIHADGGTLRHKLARISSFIVEVWRTQPALVEVLILEIVRSPKFLDAPRLRAFTEVFDLLEAILRDHRDRGEVRGDLDPRQAAFVFMGSLEILLTGQVTGVLGGSGSSSTDLSGETAVEVFLSGVNPPLEG